jgi:hypothetical protein
MRLRVSFVRVRAHRIIVTVRHAAHSGKVVVQLSQRRRGRIVRWSQSSFRAKMTFSRRMAAGRWSVVVTARPARGYQTPQRRSLVVKLNDTGSGRIIRRLRAGGIRLGEPAWPLIIKTLMRA